MKMDQVLTSPGKSASVAFYVEEKHRKAHRLLVVEIVAGKDEENRRQQNHEGKFCYCKVIFEFHNKLAGKKALRAGLFNFLSSVMITKFSRTQNLSAGEIQ